MPGCLNDELQKCDIDNRFNYLNGRVKLVGSQQIYALWNSEINYKEIIIYFLLYI